MPQAVMRMAVKRFFLWVQSVIGTWDRWVGESGSVSGCNQYLGPLGR